MITVNGVPALGPVKHANPARFATESTSHMLWVMLNAAHMKNILRRGFLLKGRDVPEAKCETDGDHTFSLCIMGLFFCEFYFKDLDALKVIKMMLIHELGEIVPGDVTPHDNIPKDVQIACELAGITEIFADIPDGEKWIELWIEYRKQLCPEARLVHELDKLECAFQAAIYSREYPMSAEDFIHSTRKELTSPELIALLDEIRELAGIPKKE